MEAHFIDLYALMKMQNLQFSKDMRQNYPLLSSIKLNSNNEYTNILQDYIFIAENEYFASNKPSIEEYLEPKDILNNKIMEVKGIPN